MSFTELKQTIRKLTAPQRREVFELLSEITRSSGKEWALELARRHSRMDAGVKYTREDLVRRHAELSAEGP
jgi:hypothetical protein